MKVSLEEILKACKADLLQNNCECEDEFEILTDTRKIKGAEIYLPLKGENFNGEDFCQNAIDTGAIGCFVTRDEFPKNAKIVLKVENTLIAYLEMTKLIREKYSPKVIAITGSSGKTTTKEMVYSVISEQFRAVKTFSNHNNEIGLCQTIFDIDKNTEVVIVEMGMRGLGEIELLSKYAQPDFAIITNVGTAHLGRLGSVENIAKAKCEITSGLNPNGTVILHNNDRIRQHINFVGNKKYYSISEVIILEQSPNYAKFIYKNNEFELSIGGEYNIENALAAIEIGLELEIDIKKIQKGLYKYRPIEKRWEIKEVSGYKIINDSYNANPESMMASVSAFLDLYKNDCAIVLGDMGELGENSKQLHYDVGTFLANKVKKTNVNNVKFITIGNLAREIAISLVNSSVEVISFDKVEDATCYIVENLYIGTTIFLKASRAMRFEAIIEYLEGEK
ncbi:MAG: UDP-N-acetylmuramoyl-tripeptide--D-alanyl-D-alanine ligase [Candidatus Gastranaerophilales bacterium]